MEEPVTDFFVANAVLAEVTELDVEMMWLLYRLECTGEDFYDAAADRVQVPEVAALFRRNGREELGHAKRVQRAIALKTGEPAEPDELQSTRFDVPMPDHVSVKMLELVLAAEQQGDAGYQGWADHEDDPEVQRLLLLNGREETIHAGRIEEAIALLRAAGA
jgi:rubrerythrin